MKKPNWYKWMFIEELTIKEAILLSLDVEPDKWLLELDITTEEVDKYFLYSFEPEEWRQKFDVEAMETLIKYGFCDLMEIARRNARMLENPKLKVNDFCVDFGYSTVNIYTFAEWVQPILEKMGKILPPEFPIKQLKTVNENVTNSPKERNSMLAVIYGMAISKYGYKPEAARNTATGENAGSINADLESLELPCSGETIKKYLKEAHAIYGKDTSKS